MGKISKDFYRELDRAKNRPGSCNCVSLAVIFVIALIAVELGLFYFFKNIKVNPAKSTIVSGLGEFSANFTKSDTGNNSFQIIVSQGTLCEKISTGKFRDLSCSFSEDGLEIDGKLSSLLPGNATTLLMPQANRGKVEFKVVSATVGKIPVPRTFAGSIASAAGNAIYESVPELKLAEVQKVEVKEGIMIITAKKTN